MWVLSPSRAAAMASMRPSWPPPRMPMVLPGGSGLSGIILERLGYALRLCRSPGHDAGGKAGIAKREDLGCEQSGIGGARFADCQRADRHAGRHLGDGEKAVEAFQRAALDGHAEHRQLG